MRKLVKVLLVSAPLGSGLAAPLAFAQQPVEDATRATAKEVVQDGIANCQAGRYEEALDEVDPLKELAA